MWIRSPGVAIAAYVCFLRARDNVAGAAAAAYGITAAALLWNGQYFMERVVVNCALARTPARSAEGVDG